MLYLILYIRTYNINELVGNYAKLYKILNWMHAKKSGGYYNLKQN